MNVSRLALKNIEKYGEYPLFHFRGTRVSNVEHSRRAGALAAVLRDRGASKGGRVLILMPNSPDVLAAFQAAWRLGAVAVPVTPQLEAREVRTLLVSSGAAVALVSSELAARFREASQGIRGLEHTLVLGPSDAPGAEDIEPAVEAASPLEGPPAGDGSDLAMLVYTAGTTGRPKGVMLTHDNLLAIPERLSRVLRIRPYAPTLHALPLSHLFGVMMMELAYELGWVSVVLPRWNTRDVFEAVQNHRVERFGAVPTMLRAMLDFADRTRYDTSSLAGVWSGGAPLPNELRIEFESTFHCPVGDGYSQSEGSGIGVTYRDGDCFRPGSAGRALPGIGVKIVDHSDASLPAHQTGEICLQGPNVMRGYWNDDEATRKVVFGGWLHTGDLGYLDDDGFLYVTGRKKDLIIKGGENVAPLEIEEALAEHPAIAEVAVVGVPDQKYGEDIWAAVALRPGMEASQSEIRAHVARYVMKFKVPTRVVVFPELPKSAAGKILKREIRSELSRIAAKPTDG